MPRRRSVTEPRRAGVGYKLADEAIEFSIGPQFAPVDYAANRAMYDPAESQLVPKVGAWAMIVRELPSIEGGIDEHVRPGRVFFLEHSDNADDAGFTPGGRYKVRSRTEWGDVWLWPHEYRVIAVETIVGLWQDGGLTFHPLRIDDARVNDITFYARSRGIPLAVAAPMALGSLLAPIGWFEASDEVADYVAMIGRMGGPLTEENHRRRREARASRKRGG